MFSTFLAVLLALICHTILMEVLMFFCQILALRKSRKFNEELLTKFPDITKPGKYMLSYQGYETTTSGAEGKDGYGSGQYL